MEKIAVTEIQRERLRTLAKKYMEIAAKPIMADRKRQWKALKDKKAEKPMILFETHLIGGFLRDEDFVCKEGVLNSFERALLCPIKQFEVCGDDIVLEPFFRIGYKVDRGSYGVEITTHHAKDSMGYAFDKPIKTPEQVYDLKKRVFSVDRETTDYAAELANSIFGDILPVKKGGIDFIRRDIGFYPFINVNTPQITSELISLIGDEAMLFWCYDEPDTLEYLIKFITDDRISFYDWAIKEGLLISNNTNLGASACSYGYTSDLPSFDGAAKKLSDLWCWSESQETATVSPDMYEEFFVSEIARVANTFGLTYYGCCEQMHDRFEITKKYINNLRAVSVSGWSNFEKMAELLGKDYVYSRKPFPAHISGAYPNWELSEKDMVDTYNGVKKYGCNTELLFRDIYDLNNDIGRLKQWSDMTRKIFNM